MTQKPTTEFDADAEGPVAVALDLGDTEVVVLAMDDHARLAVGMFQDLLDARRIRLANDLHGSACSDVLLADEVDHGQ